MFTSWRERFGGFGSSNSASPTSGIPTPGSISLPSPPLDTSQKAIPPPRPSLSSLRSHHSSTSNASSAGRPPTTPTSSSFASPLSGNSTTAGAAPSTSDRSYRYGGPPTPPPRHAPPPPPTPAFSGLPTPNSSPTSPYPSAHSGISRTHTASSSVSSASSTGSSTSSTTASAFAGSGSVAGMSGLLTPSRLGTGLKAPNRSKTQNPTPPTSSYSPTPGSSPLLPPKTVSPADSCHVTIRMRPLTDSETNSGSLDIWNVDNDLRRICLTSDYAERNRRPQTDFCFDSVQTGSNNQELYDHSAKQVVRAAMEGFNGTVFAYGQTASGKTYSMMGVDEQPGVIPQAVDDIFAYIREQKGDREYLLRVSYLEIYNETIRDLLSPEQGDLRIHEDRKRGVFVSPLKEEIVTSPKQVMKIIRRGEENRHFGATDYNEHSSRSHTIFQMIVESRERCVNGVTPNRPNTPGGGPSGAVTLSQLNLIDLAGSEKATSDTDRRKEGAFINKSLLTLGTVISKLTSEKSGSSGQHIPYRDSKLTRILQSSLMGNARISVICTISPAHPNTEESLNTLKFAARVKKVTIRAHANRIMDDKALIQKYKQEIEDLRQQLTITNMLLEKERQAQLLKQGKPGPSSTPESLPRGSTMDRQKYEEQLHEGQIVRTALKERIDHLTNLILTSKTITPKQLLDWNAPSDSASHRGSVMVSDGLLPSSSSGTSPSLIRTNRSPGAIRQTQQPINDAEFFKRHIREIDIRDEKIRQMEMLLGDLATSAQDPEISRRIASFEQSRGQPLESTKLAARLEQTCREKEELEIVLQEREEKVAYLESRVAENVSFSAPTDLMDELMCENRALKTTVTSLRLALQNRSTVNFSTDEASAFKDMTDTLQAQASQLEDLAAENLSLRSTISGLRGSVKMLELSNDMFVQSASQIHEDGGSRRGTSHLSPPSSRASHAGTDESSTSSDYADILNANSSYLKPRKESTSAADRAFDRERAFRLQEQQIAMDRIAQLEAELALAKAERR
ncbi:P-loop containing nucleoside triphosphate hydrolase protein [Phlyctochytrium arcticum]|nr:P-loop containing nucleoside triphosphate hydrolase protein [Phlyctochytrium arcticum]